jgi:hypothetical protein
MIEIAVDPDRHGTAFRFELGVFQAAWTALLN